MELAKQEMCEFLPFMSPHEVILNPGTNKISHLVLARNEQDEDTGNWFIDEDQLMKKKCDFVISGEFQEKIVKLLDFNISPCNLTRRFMQCRKVRRANS